MTILIFSKYFGKFLKFSDFFFVVKMGDEDGYEQFDVNDADIDHALNPGKFRRQTKEESIYGE